MDRPVGNPETASQGVARFDDICRLRAAHALALTTSGAGRRISQQNIRNP
tara:strand:+ start:170 stop:319 length:150 start_codon:yes stop_codon:yes gene_type:complete